MNLCQRYIVPCLLLLCLLPGCAVNSPHQQDVAPDITGAWVQSVPGGTGIQGFYLGREGRLRLINIFSMQGDSWSQQDDTIALFTHTERYPKPIPDTCAVQVLSERELVLARQGGEFRYHRPEQDVDLVNTRWLVSYIPGPPAESEPEQEVYFRLQEDGRIEGIAGCNNFQGTYTVSEEIITIGPLLATHMYCPAMAVEDNLFRALAADWGVHAGGQSTVFVQGQHAAGVFQGATESIAAEGIVWRNHWWFA